MKKLVLTTVFLTLLSGCSAGTAKNPAPESTVDVPNSTMNTPKPSSSPVNFIDPGTWTVGEDILPGTYKISEIAGDECYWEISSSKGEIINNGVGGGKPKIILQKGQTFYSSDCPVWIKQK